MNKLLSAEFVRLFKSLVFRICLLVSGGFGILLVLMRWWEVKKNAAIYADLSVEYRNADNLIFMGGFYLIFAAAVLIGVFVGTEYSDGTIRNKLTAGHTRGTIYLSKFIVCAVADVMIHLLYIFVVLIFGNCLIGGTTMTITEVISFTLVGTTAMLGLTALLIVCSMSIQSKAIGSIVCLVVALIMMILAIMIGTRLEEPKYYDGYTYIDENTGEAVVASKEKNPNYLTGTKRKVYEFLNNVLPVSQLYQIVVRASDNLFVIVISDLVIMIVSTGAGMVIFGKKDLK